jgi:hypothetical protein
LYDSKRGYQGNGNKLNFYRREKRIVSLKVATLTIILSIVASAFLCVRSGVDAQTYQKQTVDNSAGRASSVGCPSADEMSQNAAASGLTEADIDALEQMHQQSGGIVAEPIVRERLPGGEIIYENRAVQTMTFTNFGVVRCSSFGNDMPEGEITYIGGPLDNQEK